MKFLGLSDFTGPSGPFCRIHFFALILWQKNIFSSELHIISGQTPVDDVDQTIRPRHRSTKNKVSLVKFKKGLK